ncbi:MAG: spore coat protein [Clostridia bacterium]|nr:spore coat protein [Clostridia bacterium]
MSNYKADMTLNEKDSLQDMLNLEKSLVKIYSTAMTEGASKGFRTLIKSHWAEASEDQLQVFLQMTEHGYYQVESAPETVLSEHKNKFSKIKGQLS